MTVPGRAARRLRPIAACVFAWTLAACRSAPIADRPPTSPAPVTAANPAPAQPSDAEASTQPIDVPMQAPIETPIIVPPCVPVEAAPKSKRRAGSKPPPKATPAPSAATAASTAQPAATDAVVQPLDGSIVSVLGKKVRGAKGEDLGRVVDVLADAKGRVRIAVIEVGGFLGIGNRRIAVDLSLLRFPTAADDSLILSVSRDRLQSAPEYKNSNHPQALMAPQTPGAAPPPGAAEGNK
jgi:hypothetical protein